MRTPNSTNSPATSTHMNRRTRLHKPRGTTPSTTSHLYKRLSPPPQNCHLGMSRSAHRPSTKSRRHKPAPKNRTSINKRPCLHMRPTTPQTTKPTAPLRKSPPRLHKHRTSTNDFAPSTNSSPGNVEVSARHHTSTKSRRHKPPPKTARPPNDLRNSRHCLHTRPQHPARGQPPRPQNQTTHPPNRNLDVGISAAGAPPQNIGHKPSQPKQCTTHTPPWSISAPKTRCRPATRRLRSQTPQAHRGAASRQVFLPPPLGLPSVLIAPTALACP